MNILTLLLAVIQPLWPEGKIPDFQFGQYTAPAHEAQKPNFDRAAHQMPYLDWRDKPANPNGACMIMIPGGGYKSDCGIYDWNEKFTALGYQCVKLCYRVPRPKGLPIYQSAWEDGQRAVRLVRAAAKDRGFDPERIGVIGMSAGGHLAILLATNSQTPSYSKVDAFDDIPCHIKWAIADSPAYVTVNGEKGDPVPQDGTSVVPTLSKVFAFDNATCSICFNHGGCDVYTPNGSSLCYRELRKRKIPSELHLYADIGHTPLGFDRAAEFLRQMNFDGRLVESPVAQEHRFMPDATIRTEKEMLWPKGKMPDAATNQTYDPYLVWYIPEKPTTKAIQIVLPGGGYGFCNFNGEGTPVAHYLNDKGMTTVIVMYRCPRPAGRPKHFSAWQDAQRAIRIVRQEAPERGLDPNRIGIMGFSAGGHLTLMTATNAKTPAYEPVDKTDLLPCNVQWACPIYPAYVLTDNVDGISKNGGNGDEDVPVAEFSFDADTPPMCFMHGDGDDYSAMGSVKCWEKLRSMGIQCDLHTLALREHCFQMNAIPGTGSFTWMDRVWDFLIRKKLNQ